jgi:hypothetical protein
MSRAKANGIVTGKIVETGFFYKAYSIDATDMMRLIITNDGSTNNLNSALFKPGSTYTTMGAAYGHKIGCRMNAKEGKACEYVMTVVVAEGYTNNQTVTCQPDAFYGGGTCDPNSWSASVFE